MPVALQLEMTCRRNRKHAAAAALPSGWPVAEKEEEEEVEEIP